MNILTFDIEDWYNCDFISGDFNGTNLRYVSMMVLAEY